MRQGHSRPRRRQETLRVKPIVRSQSWNVIAATFSSADNRDLISTNVGYCAAKGPLAAKPRGAKLPPLERKDWRPPIRSPSHSLGVKDVHRLSLGRDYIGNHWTVHSPRIGSPVPESDWTAAADVFLQAGEAAGIAFQWATIPTPGLFVVGVAEGSVAVRHGGIVPGMLLLEISRHRVVGMSRDEIMQSMRSAAVRPRVLTLAHRLRSLASDCGTLGTVVRPEDSSSSSPSRPAPLPGERLPTATPSASCTSHLSLPSPDSSETSSGPTSSAGTSAMYVKPSMRNARISCVTPSQDPCEQILALRFVSSRGDLSLFDRDHILGIKKRNIEFIPSGSCSNIHHTNSLRSLGELTLDWRNDPFSTPARRRRLINDVCRVVVSSYAHAAVSRVSEFRKEEAFAARIQAVARMRSARSRFKVKLAMRRERASSMLQLSWLSYAARRQTRILREERDVARRVDEIARKKRLVREQEEHIRRLEEERLRRAREAAEQEKRRREKASVILLQRRARARQAKGKVHRRLLETIRIRDQQRAALVSKAAATIQAALGRWRSRREGTARISRDKIIMVAVSLLQLTWRKKSVLGRQKCQTNEDPDAFDSTSVYGDRRESGAISGDPKNVSTSANISPPAGLAFTSVEEWQASGVDVAGFGDFLRPGTAAAALQSTSSQIALKTSSPAGMMTVRVKIGSDERSLVTPIVLRESDQKTSEDPAGTGSTADTSENNERQRGELSPKTSAAAGSINITGVPQFVDGIQPFVGHPHKPSARWDEKEEKTAEEEASALHPSYPEVSHAMQDYTDNSYQAIPTTNVETRPIIVKDEAAPLPLLVAPETHLRGLHCDLAHETLTRARPHEQFTARSAGFAAERPQEEHYIMEDSQVYLGCALCGLKYLVESVVPRLPEPGQGKPAPEVLYLCTACGGTLRDGEDGHWRRRRRPSSAPAAGRRNPSHDGASRWPMQGCQDWCSGESSVDNALKGAHLSEITVTQESRGSGSRTRSTTTNLRYARCARTIQHACQDFRHRQYLRDWAFSVLHRWFPSRIEARRRVKRLTFLHRAAVAIQSFARVASARTYCSLLRAARRRLWVDRAVALWDAHDAATSPEAAELLRRLNAPPLPPPQESTPCRRRHAPGNESCRIGSGRAMAEALSPSIVGPPPPGCPAPLEVDWGKWGVKLKLAFAPREPSHHDSQTQHEGANNMV